MKKYGVLHEGSTDTTNSGLLNLFDVNLTKRYAPILSPDEVMIRQSMTHVVWACLGHKFRIGWVGGWNSVEKKSHASSTTNGACAHYVMVSKFQWKPFWLSQQRDPQNDWTATQNCVNYDVFAQASFRKWSALEKSSDRLESVNNIIAVHYFLHVRRPTYTEKAWRIFLNVK